MKLRQPIVRVRLDGGRITSAPECPPVVALIQRERAVILMPDGSFAAFAWLRGFALKLGR